MRRLLIVLAGFFVLLSACKDKKEDPKPNEPAPVQYGTIHFQITKYDSLGYPESDHSNVKVYLVEDKLTAYTDQSGKVTFANLPYGNHTPVLEKEGYEGPMMTIYLNAPEYTANLPFPKHTHFKATNFQARVFSENDIYVSFNLFPPLALDSTQKVYVLGHNAANLSQRFFTSVDEIKVGQTKTTDYNVAQLPQFKSFVAGLDSGATFYITVAPASYGLYQGNLQAGPQVLGESRFPAGNVALVKKWK